MPLISAGILLFRWRDEGLEVLLAHPGGPAWKNRDLGAWTIPKGIVEDGEDPEEGARREFKEETGFELHGELTPLGEVTLKSGKIVKAWACEGDADPALLHSNTFKIVWPPRSGTWIVVPEVDRCAWFQPGEAIIRINPAQSEFIVRLQALLS